MVKLILKEALEERGFTRYYLSKVTGIKYQTVDNYYKNRVVRYDGDILSKFCTALSCQISDILVYIEDDVAADL